MIGQCSVCEKINTEIIVHNVHFPFPMSAGYCETCSRRGVERVSWILQIMNDGIYENIHHSHVLGFIDGMYIPMSLISQIFKMVKVLENKV
jgi:hypothetical protein